MNEIFEKMFNDSFLNMGNKITHILENEAKVESVMYPDGFYTIESDDPTAKDFLILYAVINNWQAYRCRTNFLVISTTI